MSICGFPWYTNSKLNVTKHNKEKVLAKIQSAFFFISDRLNSLRIDNLLCFLCTLSIPIAQFVFRIKLSRPDTGEVLDSYMTHCFLAQQENDWRSCWDVSSFRISILATVLTYCRWISLWFLFSFIHKSREQQNGTMSLYPSLEDMEADKMIKVYQAFFFFICECESFPKHDFVMIFQTKNYFGYKFAILILMGQSFVLVWM